MVTSLFGVYWRQVPLRSDVTYLEKLKDPRWKNLSGIYRININDGFYIGSAVMLTKRLRQHFNALLDMKHCNIHLQRAFDKWGSIDFEIVEIVEDSVQLISREQFYIDTLKPSYNISVTAGSQLGFRHSEESKALISKVQIGRIISLETRRRMSESRKGMKFTEAHKRNMSSSKVGSRNPWYKAGENHPQFGKSKSMETRERISKSSRERGYHKGANNSAARSGVLYDALTGRNFIFLSLKPLCSTFGLSYKGVHSALSQDRFYLDRFYASYAVLPSRHPGTIIL